MAQFIITAAPRCGTAYTARLLTQAGVSCAHEVLFEPRSFVKLDEIVTRGGKLQSWSVTDGTDHSAPAGEVSWLAIPYLDILGDDMVALHQVRHPLACVASMLGHGFGKVRRSGTAQLYERFFAKHAPEAYALDNDNDRCLAFWITWNSRAFKRMPFTYMIEDMGLTLLKIICDLVGADVPYDALVAALETVPTNTHAGEPVAVSWEDFNQDLVGRAQRMAAGYGYDG